MWSSWARPVLPRASLASPARWHMVHSIHASRHTVYWVQAQVGFGRVYFPGPNRVGARAHFMRWAQPILRLSRRACARANDGLACVNAGQPLMKNLSHFVKSVLYIHVYVKRNDRTPLEDITNQFHLNIGLATSYNKTPRTMISKTCTFWKTIPVLLYGTGYIKRSYGTSLVTLYVDDMTVQCNQSL